MTGGDYIPVIDLTGARSGDPQARREVAATIDAVCRESGFLVVTGHGVDPDLIERIHRTTIDLFDQPDEWKAQYDCAPDSPRCAASSARRATCRRPRT